MTATTEGVTPIKATAAVLSALLLFSVLSEVLESTLVRAAASGPIDGISGYFAVRNQLHVLGAKAVFNVLVAVLAGYTAGRIAGGYELTLGSIVAALQTCALAWGFSGGEFADQTPLWMRGVLLLTTGPAMLAGAWVRAQARVALGPGAAGAASPPGTAGHAASDPRPEPQAKKEMP